MFILEVYSYEQNWLLVACYPRIFQSNQLADSWSANPFTRAGSLNAWQAKIFKKGLLASWPLNPSEFMTNG